MNSYQNFIQYHKEIKFLESISASLYWDQVTIMPKKGSAHKAQQMGTIAKITHEKMTSSEYQKLLENAENDFQDKPSLDPVSINLRKLRWQFDRAQKLSSTFVEKLTQSRVAGSRAWENAKKESSFSIFQNELETLVILNKEAAEAFGYDETSYDALIEDYEFGTSSRDLDRIFPPLQQELTDLVFKLKDREFQNMPILEGVDFSVEAQKEL